MAGWDKLWKDPAVARRWREMPPDPEVVEMADLLDAERRKLVLDIGCGVGRNTAYLAARGFDVTATDNSPAAIAECKDVLALAKLRATVVEVDMTELPFPDSHFDGAIASHVIHHTDRATLERVVNHITRLLRPGGIFVWIMPSPRHYRHGHGVEVEPGTCIDEERDEGLLPHRYCSEEEVRELLRPYDILSMTEQESGEEDKLRYHWRVLARKRARR